MTAPARQQQSAESAAAPARQQPPAGSVAAINIEHDGTIKTAAISREHGSRRTRAQELHDKSCGTGAGKHALHQQQYTLQNARRLQPLQSCPAPRLHDGHKPLPQQQPQTTDDTADAPEPHTATKLPICTSDPDLPSGNITDGSGTSLACSVSRLWQQLSQSTAHPVNAGHDARQEIAKGALLPAAAAVDDCLTHLAAGPCQAHGLQAHSAERSTQHASC